MARRKRRGEPGRLQDSLAKVASGVVTLQEVLAKVGLDNSSELATHARRPSAQQRDVRYFERVIATVDGSGRPG